MKKKPSSAPSAIPAATLLLNSFRRLVRALRLSDRTTLQEYGLGSAQIYVLHHLSLQSPLSVNDLAARTGTDQSTISVVVNKLVDRGLVLRAVSSEDARRAELTLTRAGAAMARRLPVVFQEAFLDAAAELPPRRIESAAETLNDILVAMGIDLEGPAPMLVSDPPRPPEAKRPPRRKRPAPR